MNDHELLQRYCNSRCEASFTELVERYVDLIYSAALRQVGGDEHLAQDVAQTVFIDLARKADSLSDRTVLAGWLYTSTHYAAAKVVRTEQRWRAREQKANSMRETSDITAAEPSWEELRPVIDQAMHELNKEERDAVLLRFFEKRQLGEVGAKLGVSEEAARKRVDRALDKLRGLLARRGVTSTSAALVMILGTHTISAAPVGMATSIAGAAIASTVAGTGGTLTILKLMAMSKLKLGLIGAVVLAGVATPLVIQRQSQETLRAENQGLRQKNAQLAEQMMPLAAENARLSNLIAQAAENRPGQQSQSNELLRLRGEVARLRQDARDSARSKGIAEEATSDPEIQAVLRVLATRVTQLHEKFDQAPNKKIPELKFLSDKDWLAVVGDIDKMESDEDFSQGMGSLRSRAKSVFGSMMRKALRRYADANGGLLPTDITQLEGYFDQPVDVAALQRYQMAQSGKLSDMSLDTILIKEIGPRVDDEHDSHFEFSVNGTTSHSGGFRDVFARAASAYANANSGMLPKTPEQVATYLDEQVDPARLQKYLSEIPANVTTFDQLKALRH